MKTLAALTLILAPLTSTLGAESCSVSLAQDPVVMRLGKDEFRIAFGLHADRCAAAGCTGTIEYDASWKADDGVTRSERKHLVYAIPDGAQRSIVVDRHYFDTSEGKHTTDVTQVAVQTVSCQGAEVRATASR